LPYTFALLGIVEGDNPLPQMEGSKKRRTLDAIKRILLREILNQSLMVEFEDLRWIDSETSRCSSCSPIQSGLQRFKLWFNYRPEYSHQWSSKTCYTRLRLDPLGKESAEEMLSARLDDGKYLMLLKRLIIETNRRQALFMEVIVQTLFEDGVLQHNNTVKLVLSMNTVNVLATV
jgi:hypothetical protein